MKIHHCLAMSAVGKQTLEPMDWQGRSDSGTNHLTPSMVAAVI